MRPAELNRLTVREAADRYVELVRAKTLTGALSLSTAEVYARDVATLVALAGEGAVLDDLTGEDVDAILLAFARKPDGRRAEPTVGLQSASSQARFRRSISALFKHATLAGWVQINPMAMATVTARERGGLRARAAGVDAGAGAGADRRGQGVGGRARGCGAGGEGAAQAA
ncbi:hypothetical protein [Nonomuraea dietziae]|uniref:hypothetical protein n=1 Tax=Nonomuraea dietziae TaxID=65515 RepID=UPI0031D4E0A4